MARDSSDREEPTNAGEETGASHEPRECMACRGTGQLISKLGGATSRVSCPWCDGGGTRLAEVDAQARWRDSQVEDTGGQAKEPAEPPNQ